jgi:hypothetical protein
MSLSGPQAEEDSEVVWDAVEFAGGRLGSGSAGIASQSFLPREAIMGALRTGEDDRLLGFGSLGRRWHLHIHSLAAQQLDTRASMLPAAPVTPSQGGWTDNEGMQQHAHLARLRRGVALPLTLLPQRTGTATADAGSIDHAQAPIGLSTLLMGTELLVRWTAERPIWLESEIMAREATNFPRCSHLRRSIA